MNAAIRPAREDEYDAVARIWMTSAAAAGLCTASDDFLQKLRARIPDEIAKGWHLYVAVDDEVIVAMLALVPADKCLHQIFVAPNHLGHGIGTMLMAFAREKMPDEIWLHASTANTRATRWYESEGFVKEREEVRDDEPAPRVYYRWKRI